MRTILRHIAPSLLALALLSPLAITGCAARVSAGYRVYDVDHGDYHVFTDDEIVYYKRWENETHRDDRDFRKRSESEQKEYWTWRHNQK